MGDKAVRPILNQLSKELKNGEPDHWFWALRSITGRNPVGEDERGNMRAMAEAWLAWGREQGYVG